jgi:hypothetical protein
MYMSQNAGGGGVSANKCSCAHGAQLNFGDLGKSIINLWLEQKKILNLRRYYMYSMKISFVYNTGEEGSGGCAAGGGGCGTAVPAGTAQPLRLDGPNGGQT